MKRATFRTRLLILTPSAALLASALHLSCSAGDDERRPPDHVLMILVDTLRADHLGSYGHPRSPTPAIDSVAEEGVRFEEAYSQSSWTAPSVVSLFTSRYVADDRLDLPGELPTLAESFSSAGWATGGFIMNDIVKEEQGFRRGFDHFEQMVPYAWETATVRAWIEANRAGKSFTYVHLNEAHDPYLPPEPWLRWRREPDPVSAKRKHYYETVQRELSLHGELEDEVRHIETEVGGYVDDVHYTDRRIAELLAVLDESGLSERTCVVITSDHGEGLWTRVAFMTGQRGRKLGLGEQPRLSNTLMPTHGLQVNRELVHVPWVMRGPGLPAGAVVEGPVELVDLFPTLLEVCDLPVPHGLQGTSRMPAVEGRALAPAEAFSHTRFASTLITPDGWQVIVPTAEGECQEALRPELYNLREDPEARINRALEEPGLLEELTDRVIARREIGLEREGAIGPALTPQDLASLDKLGYLDAAVVAVPDPDYMDLPIQGLVSLALDGEPKPCAKRLAIAKALEARREELGRDLRDRLRSLIPPETSDAVRGVLETVIDPN